MVIAVGHCWLLSPSKDRIIRRGQPGVANPNPRVRLAFCLLSLKELHTMTAGVWLLHLNKHWMLLICSAALG